MRKSSESKEALSGAKDKFHLSRRQARALIRWGERSHCPLTLRRCMGVAKVGRGVSCTRAARELMCAPSTVVSAAHRYRKLGRDGLRDRRAENGRQKADSAFDSKLAVVLRGVPEDSGWCRPTWTRELLALEMESRSGVRVSVATMGRALARLGARLKRGSPIVECPWPDWKRRRRLWQLWCLAQNSRASEPVLYVDEVDIHLNPKIGADWCLPGQRRLVRTPGNNKKRYLAGALDARTERLVWVEAGSKASSLFIKLLWRLAGEYRRARRIHLILDNASIHSSKKTRKVLEQLGGKIVLHFLPPYCPKGNRIERVWLDLHANVTRNHRCRRMDALMRRVHGYLHARNRTGTPSPAVRREDLRAAA